MEYKNRTPGFLPMTFTSTFSYLIRFLLSLSLSGFLLTCPPLPISFPSSLCHKLSSKYKTKFWWEELLGSAEHFQALSELIMVAPLSSLCWTFYLTLPSSNSNLLAGEAHAI